MCVLLADFLRESLALGAETRITLERELGLVARFLAVERVRYGDRLRDDDHRRRRCRTRAWCRRCCCSRWSRTP